MPPSLRQNLSDLASSFAGNVLDAVRAAPIEELGETAGDGHAGRRVARASAVEAVKDEARSASPGRGRRPRSARLGRRSAADIAGVIDRIAGLLRQSPKGLRAEQIRKKLGLQAKELPRPLKEGFENGRLGKSGEKRATTYVLKGAGAPGPVATAAAGPPTPGRRPRAARGRSAKTAARKTAAKRKK